MTAQAVRAQHASETAIIPTWTLGDRMGKALNVSGIGVAEMAEILGVSRASIGRWIGDHGPVKRGHLVAWATLTNTDLKWLETGEGSDVQTLCFDGARQVLRLVHDQSVKADLTPGSRPARHLRSVS